MSESDYLLYRIRMLWHYAIIWRMVTDSTESYGGFEFLGPELKSANSTYHSVAPSIPIVRG